MRTKTTYTFDRPVKQVFAYLADPQNRPQWQSSITDLSLETEGPPRKGTRWQEKAKGIGTVEMEIVEFKPERIWTEHGRGKTLEVRIRLDFSPEGSSTRVDVDATMRAQGMVRLLLPVARLVLPRIIRRDLARAQPHIPPATNG